ncbi:sigma-70 family RNA polymerase sigma factor [Streptomyces cyaneochromogenes]|uniref:sigma-70 family RNA polymerase sigma factor n=1 Tax=Streptomyces cyaneochromogenes TaxID=2496836 RepID=UPI001E28EFB2|nr:sigma-70 family RNA polymerase sigma factor [Streptomyces cyaneochromogenes]
MNKPERSTTIALLFSSSQADLLRLAARMGADADAEDIVAEAFFQLYKNWDELQSMNSAVGYLRATVRNLSRMRVRRLIVARRYADHQVAEPLVHSAEHQAIRRNEQQAVVTALRALPRRQYQALVLRHWMDLKEGEIAEAMGISVGAVKSHTSRGMTKLSEILNAAPK